MHQINIVINHKTLSIPSIPLLLTIILCFVLPWLVIIIKVAANQRKKKHLNTPPGSMGLPLIGDTLNFMNPHPSTSLGQFLDLKIKRYGKIFKTHILGNPTIISADIGFNQFVLKNDGSLFGRNFPKFIEKLLVGTTGEMGVVDNHRFMKNIIGCIFGVPNLQSSFLYNFQVYTLGTLESWDEDVPFPAQEETRKLTFYMILKSILSLNPGEEKTEKLRELFHTFSKGFQSLPLDLPGSNFRRAIKSRKAIYEIIEGLKHERIQNKKEESEGKGDCLDMLLENPSVLTTNRLVDQILGLILAGHDTSAAAIALAMYFLGGCQEAVQQLREEHMRIARLKEKRGVDYLSWEDYKQMEFTQCVINETLRLGNVVGHLYRKALAGSRFEGYNIPEGWSVILLYTGTHLDGEVYPEAQRFNPWRWQVTVTSMRRPDSYDIFIYFLYFLSGEQRTSITKAMLLNYMPFSQGLHQCPGMGLTRMEMAIFLHYLVLKYDWERMAPEEQPVLRSFFPVFSRGMLIKVHCFPSNLRGGKDSISL